jgi:cell division protease FtsH
MKMLLGGFVTEQIIFNRVTTGASDDLRRVAEISRSMIEQYGMGTKLLAHLDGTGGDKTSQAALEARDKEQQLLIEQAQFDARMLVLDNRDLLDRIAQALLEKESIERHELEELVANEAGPAEEEDAGDLIVSLPSIGLSLDELVVDDEFAADERALPRARRESVPPPSRKVPAPVRTTPQD